MNHSLAGLSCTFHIWAPIFNFASLGYSGFLGETPLVLASSLKVLAVGCLWVLVNLQWAGGGTQSMLVVLAGFPWRKLLISGDLKPELSSHHHHPCSLPQSILYSLSSVAS